MKPLRLALMALVAGCSSLPDNGGGIVALEITPPSLLSLTVGQTDTLHARALDINGDSTAADIFWRTPDTSLVSLDSVRGILVGRVPGTARIQARVGTLASDPIVFTIVADTTTPPGIRRQP